MNLKIFFDFIRGNFPGSLDDHDHEAQRRVGGFDALLAEYGASGWTDHRWFAYLLATAWHETDFTMQPVREAFWEPESWREQHLRYYPWYGRGFVQLTWATNYARADRELHLAEVLIHDPDLALNLDVASKIIFRGMGEGWFTGKSLGDYIHGTTCDYVNARRIINGTDKANAIAAYAVRFEKCISAAEMVPAA